MALGHWLKDYIGPKASANSGGGGTSDVLVVHDNDNTLDKTWQEIYDAMSSGKIVYVVFNSAIFTSSSFVSVVRRDDDGYVVQISGNRVYTTSSENGYPVYEDIS